MKHPTAKPASQQPWCPGHWLTLSGLGLDPTDLRKGTTPGAEDDAYARRQIVATSDADHIIHRLMQDARK